MDYKNRALNYFNAFSEKNLLNLKFMFDQNVTLRDWDIYARGVVDVMEANQKIFDSVDTIKVTPLALYQQDTTVIAELTILVNGTETLLVTDIIEFTNDGKIKRIRAYKG